MNCQVVLDSCPLFKSRKMSAFWLKVTISRVYRYASAADFTFDRLRSFKVYYLHSHESVPFKKKFAVSQEVTVHFCHFLV